MSSRRKSSNPCVLRATGFTPEDSVAVSVETAPAPPPTDQSGISLNQEEEEKQGSFYTPDLRNYRDHSEGPFYVRTICNFTTNNFDSLSCHNKAEHPNESCLKPVDCENDGSRLDAVYDLGPFVLSGGDAGKPPMENSSILEKDEIRAVSVNGTIIILEPVCHVTPLLQRPPNLSTSPAIAVPLHTSKYNPILDHNTTLITSFNRFPYPTVPELSWLTAASKHSEEQIKAWFTTQRLKQGITWSPEEVEEARKKMFNGSIPTPHQTCAVSPTPAGEPPDPGQATSHEFGLGTRQTLSLGAPLLASEVQCPVVPPPGDPRESLRMPPPPAPPPERLAFASSPGFSETKTSGPASLVASGMKIPACFVPPKGNLHKEALPSVLSKESVIVSTNLKRALNHQQINNHTSASSFVPKNKLSCFGNGVTVPSPPAGTTQQVNRPTLIQTLSPSPTPVLQSTEPPMFPCFSNQNGKEIPNGDVKHWSFDQTTDSQNSCVERSVPTQFPLLERVKDKSEGQIKLLEESFQRNSFPSYNEVEHLTLTTRLTREELESWFLQRRALRDYLEQALLNSMGSKPEEPVPNGAQRRSGTHAFSPVPPNSKSINLVKNVFVQSRWPSPVEFRHLEKQTRMSRRELLRWVRDSRRAQQSHGVLDLKGRPLREENIKPRSPEIEDWHAGSNGGATGEGREDTCEPLSDSS